MCYTESTAGGSACHLTLSPDERFLYVANYDDGKLSVFPVMEGKVGPRVQLIQHEGHGPDPRRQAGPHGRKAKKNHTAPPYDTVRRSQA